jgi:prepilin-type processing-associated H-X9-DG protein
MQNARSVSMNQAVGTVDQQFYDSRNGHSGRPNRATKGPWLTGSHGNNNPGSDYATFGKMSDFKNVSPAQIFVQCDENPYSLNDAGLAVWGWNEMTPTVFGSFIDYPSTLHSHGGGFSFCDGHAEIRKWRGTAIDYVAGGGQHAAVTKADQLDFVWLATHASKHW